MKLLSKISEKVRKYGFQIEKKTNKAKLEIFKFLRISALSQGYNKIGSNYVLSANSTKIWLLGYFCMQN